MEVDLHKKAEHEEAPARKLMLVSTQSLSQATY